MKHEEELEDVVFEETEEGEGEAYSLDKIKKLREKLKEVEKEKAEYLTSWQKERADFINYKKDEDKRRKEVLAYATTQVVEDLLPVLDAYDMAFANTEAWEKVDPSWRTGVEYIHSQLLKVLESHGITEITTKVGDTPDASVHEQVEVVPTEEKEKDNTISSVLQKGYKHGDRIIRPVRVKVWGLKE